MNKQVKSEMNNQWSSRDNNPTVKASSREKDATNNQWTSTIKNSVVAQEHNYENKEK